MDTLATFWTTIPWLPLLGGLCGLWLVGNLFTGPMQHLFIFRPTTFPVEHVYQHPLPFTEHWIDTPHGGQLNALYIPFAGKAKGTVLFFHGNAGTLDQWGYTYTLLHEAGYHLLIYDYRGYGKSTGYRTQERLYQDAEAVYDWLRQRETPERIVLYGRSMGSTFACRVAASRSCRLLILETPFSSMRDLFYSYYPFLPPVFRFKYSFPSRRYLEKVDASVVVFQGTRDFIVPYRNARRLIGALKSGDRFVKIEGGGHRDLSSFERFRHILRNVL